jgi:hypothetical protein
MRAISTVIEGASEESLKKIAGADPFLQIMPILKSSALILAYMILPK